VAAVEGEEFALYVGNEVVGELHAADFGAGTLECGFFNDPFVKCFHSDGEDVVVFAGGEGGDDTIDGAVGEADVFVEVLIVFGCDEVF